MALFDNETDPALGGAVVTPSGELDASQESTPVQAPPPIAIPDVSPIVAAMPGHTPLPPPQPIPNPANDPRQRLIALFTAGLSAGLGPHSGVGAGLGYHLAQQQQEQHDLALKQWQLNENERQRQIQAITQQNAELDRQRANSLQAAFTKIGTAASTAETKDDYDKAMDQWGSILAASGFRVSPTWLRQNFPWQSPSRVDKIKKAVAKFKANPNNQRLLDQQPELASQIQLNIDEGMPVPLDQALEAIGEGFAKGPNGELLIAPKPMAGTAPFDVILNGKMEEWRATNPGKDMDAKTKNDMISAAAEQAKEKAPGSSVGSLQDYIVRYAKEHGKKVEDLTTAEINKAAKQHTDATQKSPILSGMNAMYAATDPKAIAAGIRSGDMPPDISQYGRAVQGAIASELAKPGPNGERPFNLSDAQRTWKAQINLNRTMNGAQQVRLDESIRSGLAMYDKVDELADKWDGMGLGPLSRANMKLAMEGALGPSAASLANQLNSQVGQLTSDVATIEQGGLTPTAESRKIAEQSLQSWWGRGTIRDLTAQGRYNMQIRHLARANQAIQAPGNAPDLSPALPATPPTATVPSPTRVYYDINGKPIKQ